MTDDERIRWLLDEILDTGRAPKEVCAARPDLLSKVQAQLDRLLRAEREISLLFPTEIPADSHLFPGAKAKLPQIEGYEVTAVLGNGGMGVVFRARHLHLKRTVALKMLRFGPYGNNSDLQRFKREYEALAELNHPGIVQVYDVGTSDDQPYFTMEFVCGPTLEDDLAGEPQSPINAASLVSKLAVAIEAAHAQGIFHRDLKPSNIMLTADYEPKITDFGLARFAEDGTRYTASGVVVGTPSYMAPEQARGRIGEIGPLIDVYALGAILYEMLTGRPPFRGESRTDTIQQVINQEPVPPSRLNAKVPRDLETICLRCLEKAPDKRYPSAAVLRSRLKLFLSGRPIPDRPIGNIERLWRWSKRNKLHAVAVSSILILLIVIAGISAYSASILRLALEESRRQEVLTSWDHARRLCEDGEIGYGLLMISRSLERVPAGNDNADLREALTAEIAGWHTRCHTLERVLPHPGSVSALAITSDGKTVVTGCADGYVRMWDLDSGKCRRSIAAHKSEVCAVALSDFLDTLITGGTDGQVLMWNIGTGELIASLDGHREKVCAIAVSPDGELALTGSADKSARLWNLRELSCRRTLEQDGAVFTVGFAPDGLSFFTAGKNHVGEKGRLSIFQTASHAAPQFLITESESKFAIRSASFSPDGSTLLVGDDNWDATFYDANDNHRIASTDYARGRIRGVAFANDSQVAILGAQDSCAVMLWDVRVLRDQADKQADGGLVLTDAGYPGPILPVLRHPQPVTGVLFVPSDGRRFLSSCEDGYVRVWRQAKGPSAKIVNHNPRRPEHTKREFVVRTTAIDPSGQLAATAGDDGKIRFWDVNSGEENGSAIDCASRVMCLEFTSDSQAVVAGTRDGQVQVWDLRTRKPAGKTIDHALGLSGLDINGDEIMVGGGGIAHRWNIYTSEPIGNPMKHSDDSELSIAVAIATNNQRFLTMGEDGKVKLWDNRGKIIAQFNHGNQVRGGAFSPDSAQAVTASDDGTVRVWDANTGMLVSTLAHESEVHSAAFVSRGRVVTCSRRGAQIWDLRLNRRLGPPCKYRDDVLFAACSSDGRTAVLANWNGYGVIWSIPQANMDDPSATTLWLQNEVGMELDAAGGPRVLTGREWLNNNTIIPSLH